MSILTRITKAKSPADAEAEVSELETLIVQLEAELEAIGADAERAREDLLDDALDAALKHKALPPIPPEYAQQLQATRALLQHAKARLREAHVPLYRQQLIAAKEQMAITAVEAHQAGRELLDAIEAALSANVNWREVYGRHQAAVKEANKLADLAGVPVPPSSLRHYPLPSRTSLTNRLNGMEKPTEYHFNAVRIAREKWEAAAPN